MTSPPRRRGTLLARCAEHREHQHGRPHHGDVDAEVEQRRRGERQFAEHGRARVAVRAGEEGLAEVERADAGEPGDAQPEPDPAREAPTGTTAQYGLGALLALRHVLQHQRHRRDQPGDEAAAGFVVATPEDVGGDDERDRQHDARCHAQHQRLATEAPGLAERVALRPLDAEPVEQREHADGGNAEHRDLAEGVVAAEVDQDHVHRIRPAALRLRLLEEVPADRVVVTRQHEPGQPGHAAAARRGEPGIAPASRRTRLARRDLRQERQAHQQQHGGDDVDRELRHREVGRREADKRQRGDEADAAGENHRHEALSMLHERPPPAARTRRRWPAPAPRAARERRHAAWRRRPTRTARPRARPPTPPSTRRSAAASRSRARG